MPTILRVKGFRFFFFSLEGKELPHILPKLALILLLFSGTAFGFPTTNIREASPKDVGALVTMVRELAAYENKKPEDVLLTSDKVLQHAFGKEKYFQVILAERDKKPVAYALYFFSYSAYKGAPVLYIEDLYVAEAYRHQGIGTALLSHLKNLSKEKECCRMEWHVFDWNKSAIQFYKSSGAILRPDLIQVRLENP